MKSSGDFIRHAQKLKNALLVMVIPEVHADGKTINVIGSPSLNCNNDPGTKISTHAPITCACARLLN
jgi:hypothetical protein